MQNNTVSIIVDEQTALKIISFYKENEQKNSNEYVRFFAKDETLNLVITLFKPKKDKQTMSCVFQGENCLKEASIWGTVKEKKENKLPSSPIKNKFPQIGSDEVGTGDFFGPVVVCAAYVDKNLAEEAKRLGVTDSKKLTDAFILSIGPKLIKKFPYSLLVLDNEKYNEVHDDFNMNAIKAKMHNRVLLNLKSKFPTVTIYQDQFAAPQIYYSYLKNDEEVLKGINFSTKGESKYISIAVASCIARYAFLKEMAKLSEKYKLDIPFGGSNFVTEFAINFVNKFSIDELNKIVKQNFVNYSKVLERIK